MADSYWAKRGAENDKRLQASKEGQIAKLQKIFADAEKRISAELDAFWRKYSTDGKVAPAIARKHLTVNELKSFRATLKAMGEAATADGEKAFLQGLAAYKRMSRQDALLGTIRHWMAELAQATDSSLDEFLTGLYSDTQEHAQYDIEQYLGMGVDFGGVTPAQVIAVVHTGYDGRDYSGKIWYDRDTLSQNLGVILPRAFVTGQSVQNTAQELSKAMGSSLNDAVRLVRTEGSFIASKADMSLYSSVGVTSYEFVATLDQRTDEECGWLDGQHFPISQAEVGVNLPPIHPNCRCTTVPDVDVSDLARVRIARDEDGHNVYIPEESYSVWKKKKDAAEATGNVSIRAMASQNQNEEEKIQWPPKGNNITREQYTSIRAYADSKNIQLSGFEKSDVDVDLAREMIDECDQWLTRYPELRRGGKNGNSKFTLGVQNAIDPNEFANTSFKRNTITLNTNALRDKRKLIEEYDKAANQGTFVKGTTYKSIVAHEIGHLLEDKYKIDGAQIAKRIFGVKTYAELINSLTEKLSKYSADTKGEITSEMFSASLLSNPPKYVLDFLKECDKIILSDKKGEYI
jgi:SPP1 gp7 family putative phage head morphogenesis protein